MAAIRITDLKRGDEVYAYMRLGRALEQGQRGDTSVYGRIPSRNQKARPEDLTRWQGTVLVNNTDEQVLTCQVTRTDSMMRAMNREPRQWVADIHYSAFSRLLFISPINFEPIKENLTFPANFPDAAFKPYRTFTRVIIPSYVTGAT